VRRRKLKAILDIQTALEQGIGPKNTGDFVCRLAKHLFERMEPVLGELDDATDTIEENLLITASADLREAIVGVRKKRLVFVVTWRRNVKRLTNCVCRM